MEGSLQNLPSFQTLSDGSGGRQYLFFTLEGHVFEHIIKLHSMKDGAELWYCEWDLEDKTQYLPLICRIDTKDAARVSNRKIISDAEQWVRVLLKKWRKGAGPVILWGDEALQEGKPMKTGNPESIY